MLDQLQYGYAYLEYITGTVNKDVVPNSNTESQGKAIKEERLEPLLKPKKVWYADILKVLIEFR